MPIKIWSVALAGLLLVAMAHVRSHAAAPAPGTTSQPRRPAQQTRPATTTPSRTVVTTPPKSAATIASDLLNQLNSPLPLQQAAARQQVVAIGALLNQRKFVENLLAVTQEPELKKFLTDRLAKLIAQETPAQPDKLAGLSFNVVNVSLSQVAEVMNNALAGSITVKSTGASKDTYSLDANNMPLWQVYAALSRQHNLSLAVIQSSSQVDLVPSAQEPLPMSISGDSIAFMHEFTYNRVIYLQSPPNPTTKSTLKFQLHLLADPRLRGARITSLRVRQATMDGMAVPPDPMNPGTSVNANIYTFSISPAGKLGKTLSFTCEGTMTEWVGEVVTVIENVDDGAITSVVAGNATYWISTLTLEEPGTLKISGRPNAGTLAPLAVTARLVDAKGMVVCSCPNVPVTNTPPPFVIHPKNFTRPFRLEISAPEKNVSVPVHFEFKDVPLPQ